MTSAGVAKHSPALALLALGSRFPSCCQSLGRVVSELFKAHSSTTVALAGMQVGLESLEKSQTHRRERGSPLELAGVPNTFAI